MAAALSGKTALVTGAGGAIGAAISKRLADEGAHVIIADVAPSLLSRVAETLKDGCTVWQVDLRETGDLIAAARELEERVGRVDIVVNNAARQIAHKSVLDISTENFDDTFKTNIYALFWIVKAAIPKTPIT